jgi:hypothetical protein
LLHDQIIFALSDSSSPPLCLRAETSGHRYMTVGTYSWGCGYDWNGAAVDVDRVPELAKRWHGSRLAALLFRFDPVDEACVRRAYRALQLAGFEKIHVIPKSAQDAKDPYPIP